MKIEKEIRNTKTILFECVCDHYQQANTTLPLSKWLPDNMPHADFAIIKSNSLPCLNDLRTDMVEELFAEELQKITDAKYDAAAMMMIENYETT